MRWISPHLWKNWIQEKTVIVFRMLPKALATDVFAELPAESQSHIINSITDKELSEIVEDLYVDDAVDMLEELPATVVRRVLKNTTPDTRKLINQFLNYPENSAGSIMTAEYVGLEKEHDRRAVLLPISVITAWTRRPFIPAM